jgi:hypothetical protein
VDFSMLKSPGTKNDPARNRRIVVMEAAAVTVAVHALLAAVFYYKPDVPPPKRQDTGRIELLNLANLPPERRAGFERWLDIHSPSHIARADSPHAPTAQLPPLTRNTPGDLPPPDLFIPPAERRTAAPEALATSAAAGGRAFEVVTRTAELKVEPLDYPRIIADGIWKLDVKLPPEAVKTAAALQIDRSEIEFYRVGAFEAPRFRITRSSGSAKFDLDNVRALLPAVNSLVGADETLAVKIIWKAGGGNR